MIPMFIKDTAAIYVSDEKP